MADNPIISSAASLLVPWETCKTVTCHCRNCDSLLAIAPNSWASCDPYLFTPGSICMFDDNIFSKPNCEPHPSEEAQLQSIICNHCLQTVGQGVQKDVFKNGFPLFNVFWTSHATCLRDITTRGLVPPRVDAVMRESSLKPPGPNKYESSCHQKQTDGQSDRKDNQGHNFDMSSTKTTSNGMHVTINELRHQISTLQDEVQYLKTVTPSINQIQQEPHDGYELIATALREVRAKGIEIELLKQENHSLELKCKQLKSMALTRVERSSTINDRSFAVAPSRPSQPLTMNPSGPPLGLNCNGKRLGLEEFPLAKKDRNSQSLDAESNQQNSAARNLSENAVSLPPYGSQSTPVVSKASHREASNSDTDELAEPWQGLKYRKLSSNVNCGEKMIPCSAKPFHSSPNQRQAHELNQTSQNDPAKPRKKNALAKASRGRPKTKSLPAKASMTTKIPLKESAPNTVNPTNSQGTANSISPQNRSEHQPGDKLQAMRRPRRASARLSRRSSLVSPDHENTEHTASTKPNRSHSVQDSIQQKQHEENPPLPAPDTGNSEQTIPNSQSDSDNAPLDQEDSRATVNEQEESAQTAAKSRSPRDSAHDKRKSQIAARDALAKLTMQREEALEMAAH
ncbi:hypothetical protein HCBG_09007 [Histoplasma capsulatum G186AR]|uniref:Uncharacterized protein n=2 Tax=Ajellomyces capsulatus TaxID=5037 RepID=C0P0S7_AJECG|nr:uncharacterized protein HCBG_09007 [Histoplasma capsulatum G186AR]EEH02727.1 hypothetical protein HCBG_09007 [Histoplasma capsulatum G186AR]KAG5287296.1 hypothetical protein I7I52_11023 [Histoplasma capsulatum]QSS70893.1 hypothetical protein I7I50_12672 [Histoplasma capsulatum G186AR]